MLPASKEIVTISLDFPDFAQICWFDADAFKMPSLDDEFASSKNVSEFIFVPSFLSSKRV